MEKNPSKKKERTNSSLINQELRKLAQNLGVESGNALELIKTANSHFSTQVITPNTAKTNNVQQVINQYLLDIINRVPMANHESSLLCWVIGYLVKRKSLSTTDESRVIFWTSILSDDNIPDLRKVQIATTIQNFLEKK